MGSLLAANNSGRAAFLYPDFVRYQSSRLLLVVALEMQSVAVGWQVYEITHRPLALGLAGLAQFLPGVLFFLVAGHAADVINRRKLLIVCYGAFAVCSGLLVAASRFNGRSVILIYVILLMIGTVRAFNSPASRSLLPHLVSGEHLPNAIAWATTVYQVSTVMGPALGGLLYVLFRGPTFVYLFAMVAAVTASFLTPAMIKITKASSKDKLSLQTVMAGLNYISKRRIILGSISLDLFAVLFGGAVALLPVYAREILMAGPWALGLLRSAPAIGAVLMAVALAYRPLQGKVGLTLLWCVAGFGLFTIFFGISRNFFLSMAALLFVGAFDSVSVIIRATLLQVATPDTMRGRVTAVEMIFLGASNELGEFESGLTAHWFGAVPAVVLGGIGALAVTAIWAFAFPELRKADRLSDNAA